MRYVSKVRLPIKNPSRRTLRQQNVSRGDAEPQRHIPPPAPLTTMRVLLAALLLTLTFAGGAGAQLRAGDVSVGVGFALGSRSGFELAVRAMGTDALGAVCRTNAIMHAASVSCGAELHLFSRPEWFALVEVGRAHSHSREHPRPIYFLNVGGGRILADTMRWGVGDWNAGLALQRLRPRDGQTGDDPPARVTPSF